MWHEARRQERKIRGMLVDYRRRAERRRDFYEKIKADPTQFLQVHGRQCKIHLDPVIATAADSAVMMPWQGQPDVLIDRFDGRAHLDYIPAVTTTEELELSQDDRQINYERYRIVAQNSFLGIPEEKFLKQLHLEEQFGYTEVKSKKEPRIGGAAIGFNYDDTTGAHQPLPQEKEEESEDNNSDSDLDVDLAINVSKMDPAQAHEMNKHGRNYGMSSNDFYSFLTNDLEEAEAARLAREEEQEKALFAGRKSRRERRHHREKRLANRVLSPPSYAAKTSPSLPSMRDSKSKSASPEPSGKITYITSFGDDEETPAPVKTSYADKVKFGKPKLKRDRSIDKISEITRKTDNFKSRDRSPMKNEKVPNALTKTRSTSNSRRSRSNPRNTSHVHSRRSRSDSRHRKFVSRKSRSMSRSRRSRSRSRRSRSRSRRSRSRSRRSRSKSRRSKSRSRRSRSKSSSSRSRSRRSRSNSGRRIRSRSKSRYSRQLKSKAVSSHSSSRSRSRSRSKTKYSKNRRHSRRYSSSSVSSSTSSDRSVANQPLQSPVTLVKASPDNSNTRNFADETSEAEPKVIPRYYGRKKSDQSSSESSSSALSDSEMLPDYSTVNSDSRSGHGNSSTAIKTSSTNRAVIERLRKKRQVLLNRQFKADKVAEQQKTEREKLEQQAREDELREMAIKLRRRQREIRHANDSRSSSSSDGEKINSPNSYRDHEKQQSSNKDSNEKESKLGRSYSTESKNWNRDRKDRERKRDTQKRERRSRSPRRNYRDKNDSEGEEHNKYSKLVDY